MILLLKPIHLDKIWGSEKWLFSLLDKKFSLIQHNKKSVLLDEYLKEKKALSILRKKFPLLIKIIRAEKKLSLQVHPNDAEAKKEKSLGKSECWYILSAKKSSYIYLNFKAKKSLPQVDDLIKTNKLEPSLNKMRVQSGNLIYVPAGTVHAIGPGITLLEVQQSSDITYRLYDYGRGRELHLEKGLKVIDYENSSKTIFKQSFKEFSCAFFKLKKITLDEQKPQSSVNLEKILNPTSPTKDSLETYSDSYSGPLFFFVASGKVEVGYGDFVGTFSAKQFGLILPLLYEKSTEEQTAKSGMKARSRLGEGEKLGKLSLKSITPEITPKDKQEGKSEVVLVYM